MWLMTKHGFYSVVEKEPNVFHVRSRVRQDLENLVQRVPLPDADISSSDTTDYKYRVIVDKDDLLKIMRFFGDTVDYTNFKNKVGLTPDQANKHHAYAEVWKVLADALGAYGRRGHAR